VAGLDPKGVTVRGHTYVNAGPDVDASSASVTGQCDACRSYQRQLRLFRALRVKEPQDWLPQPPVIARLG
jgi:hypothetical protein